MKSGDQNALHCLHAYLRLVPINITTTILNWQEYLVNMVVPYKKENIEGGVFFLQWISFIFNVNIQVWSLHGSNIVNLYSVGLNCDKTINVLSFETHKIHVHYDPLLRDKYSEIFDQYHAQWTHLETSMIEIRYWHWGKVCVTMYWILNMYWGDSKRDPIYNVMIKLHYKITMQWLEWVVINKETYSWE